jgi:Mg2+ and Co2+ transporter CorA
MPGCPLELDCHTQISARWSSRMNIFTVIGIIVVVMFVIGYFGLH